MDEPLRLRLDRIDTPVGPFAYAVDDDGRLRAAGWIQDHPRMERVLARGDVVERTSNPGGVAGVFHAYFAGDLGAIEGLPVAFEGTAFQRAVWSALREVPAGETWSYAELARRIGRPTAVRAVGLANGANPVAVVVPCHRVIGANGSLTGYGGGLSRKRWLLDHERSSRLGENEHRHAAPSLA